MKPRFTLAVLLACLFLCPCTIYGQGQCTMQNMAGKYAFTFTGASTIVTGVAADTFHWNALYGPIAGVGVFTVKADGTVEGYYWLVAGTLNSGLVAIPYSATITLNDDCTGSIESEFQGATLTEQFVVLGNGRELRSVATQTAVPTGNWLTTAYRINGSAEQRKVVGDYLFECKNLFEFPVPPPERAIFGGAIHIRTRIAPGGDVTGTIYGKVATDNSVIPVIGRLTVNADSTLDGTQTVPLLGTTSLGKGVIFDEGKRGFFIPLMNKVPGDLVVPQPYGYCAITRIDNK